MNHGEIKGPKADEIKNLFTSVAHGYDRANDVMTMGLARLWRRKVVRWSGAREGQSVLDCATGTGDLAFEFKRAVGNGKVIGTDFCPAMLEHAPKKGAASGLPVEFRTADAMNLPFPDATFDICSIAYGIRNVENPARALSEMARVVKRGGYVMVLETGSAIFPLFDLYFRYVVPRLGGWVTGRREAYEYLNRSSSQFPCQSEFLRLMEGTGRYDRLEDDSLMGGASFVYRGRVR